MSTAMEARFWAKVDKSGDCWTWTASRVPYGYGQFGTKRRTSDRAHRVSWELAYGPIPDGLWVLHRCDNPPCVRPDHLFLGTPRDNLLDAINKGRHHAPVALSGDEHWSHKQPDRTVRGERNGAARLNPAKVRELRSRSSGGATLAELAARYGVTKQAVWLVLKGINWSHVR